MTIIFSAAAAYLGLKVGQVFEAAIPIAIIAAVGYFILMNMTFVCPDCNTEFKPKKHHLFVTVHMGRKRLAKCPKCGRFGYCDRKYK